MRSCFWRPLSRPASPSAVSREDRAPATRSASATVSSKTSASPDQRAFHRGRPSSTSLSSRDPACARPASTRLPGASRRLLQSNAICEHDLEPTEPRCLSSTGRRLPLRDAPAEGPRIRDPARGSHRAGRRHHARPRPHMVDGETPIRIDSGTFCRKSVNCTLERLATRHVRLDAPFTNLPELPSPSTFADAARSPDELAFAKLAPPDCPLAQAVRPGGPPPALPREEERVPLHPRCLPSQGCPPDSTARSRCDPGGAAKVELSRR